MVKTKKNPWALRVCVGSERFFFVHSALFYGGKRKMVPKLFNTYSVSGKSLTNGFKNILWLTLCWELREGLFFFRGRAGDFIRNQTLSQLYTTLPLSRS